MPGSPDDVPTFSTRFRGYDPEEVARFIREQSSKVAEVDRERGLLSARLEQLGETAIDFESFADELRLILETAHQAADSLRKRATDEVTSWRQSARKEVADSLTEATATSENLRRDAWTAAETLIHQSQAESKSAVEEAARESLAIMGKAEREAHRIQSSARRESEEVMRLARMEAERMLAEARSQHDDIVEQARVQADSAQERARALEVRRAELLEELDSVQVAVARLEEDLKRKREELEAAPPPQQQIVRPPVAAVSTSGPTDNREWTSETIKLIPAAKKTLEPKIDPVDAGEMAEEVRRLNRPEPAVMPTAPADKSNDDRGESFPDIKIIPAATATGTAADVVDTDQPEHDQPEHDESGADPGPDDEPAAESAHPPAESEDGDATDIADQVDAGSIDGRSDDLIGGLFASLRETAEVPVVTIVRTPPLTDDLHPAEAEMTEALESDGSTGENETAEESVVPSAPAALLDAPPDALELRDQLLLPIMNRVLRDIKRQLTEAQNLALEQLRVSEDEWEPNVADLTERVHGDLTIVAQESFAAGYEAVEVMTSQSPGRPKPTKSDIPNVSAEFADALASDLVAAAAKGDGPRAAAAAISRAYRAWRTDTAERRVRALARTAYHRGIARGFISVDQPAMVWAVAGRGCPDCRTVAEAGSVSPSDGFANGVVPPLHHECSCTVVPDA